MEHGAVVAESSVRNLVAQLKVEIGGADAQVMVNLDRVRSTDTALV